MDKFMPGERLGGYTIVASVERFAEPGIEPTWIVLLLSPDGPYFYAVWEVFSDGVACLGDTYGSFRRATDEFNRY